MNQENNKAYNVIMYVIALLLTALLYAAGTACALLTPEPYAAVYGIAWLVLLAILVLLFVFNKVAARMYTSRYKKLSVAERDEYVRTRQKSTGEDLDAEIFKIRRLYRFFIGYTIGFGALLVIFTFLSGAISITEDMRSAGFMIISLWCIEGFIRLIPRRITEKDFAGYSRPSDYPYIHSLARRAADKLGVKGEIRIQFADNYDAAIARIGKRISVFLGTRLLDILSEDELYNILLHEFGHLTEKVEKTPKESRLYNILSSYEENKRSLFKHFVNYPAILFIIEYSFYSLIASIYIEKEADNAVVEHGNASDAAHALVKIHLQERYSNALAEFNIFESPTPREDFSRAYADGYKKALRENGNFWISLAKKEIQPRNASHPILRSRIEALGITEMEIVFPDDEGSEYRLEAEKAFNKTAEEITKYLAENYEKNRHTEYVLPSEEVKRWQENGESIAPEESRPIIEALGSLCRFDEAEALCDRIIAEADNKFATAYAHYIKGFFLTKRYDDGCLEHLYTAIELNRNYTDPALELIGEFCCVTGNQEELDEYRRRAIELTQRSEDESSEGFDSGKTLSHSLSDEKLNTILEYIKSVDETDEVAEVFCVDHINEKNHKETAFILRFKDNNSETTVGVYNKIFNILDTDPDGIDYSLSVYDEKLGKLLKSIKDSSVYRRD